MFNWLRRLNKLDEPQVPQPESAELTYEQFVRREVAKCVQRISAGELDWDRDLGHLAPKWAFKIIGLTFGEIARKK